MTTPCQAAAVPANLEAYAMLRLSLLALLIERVLQRASPLLIQVPVGEPRVLGLEIGGRSVIDEQAIEFASRRRRLDAAYTWPCLSTGHAYPQSHLKIIGIVMFRG
jgi:hypothetical protein